MTNGRRPLRALVLTFDKYRPIALHMMGAYAALWPDHPLVFRIPHQGLPMPPSPRIEMTGVPAPIKATVLAMLADLADDEWVYWCIDDKYPIAGEFEKFAQAARWLPTIADAEIAGILLCRARALLDERALTGRSIDAPWGERLLERAAYNQIWLHQFLRVKVLRHIFDGFPDAIPAAKDMDDLIRQVAKPDGHRLFVAERNLAVFGESTRRGVLTLNCKLSMEAMGMPMPDFYDGHVSKAAVMGGDRR